MGPATAMLRPARRTVAFTVVSVVIVILAGVGLGVTVAGLRAAGEAERTAPLGVGSVVATSFGRMWVSDVQRTDGTTHEEMGMGPVDVGDMGIHDLVPPGSVAVSASLTFVNERKSAIHIGPDQFRLIKSSKDGTKSLEPARSTLAAAGELPPKSSLEAQVTFVLPADGSSLRLAYRDPARHDTRIIDLGRNSVAPADPHHNH